jgi:PhzF family phenazine biosynthesis protein
VALCLRRARLKSQIVEERNKTMSFRLFQVDSFTTELFKGNPAGVCVLDADVNKEVKQAIAAEMNCSETSFIVNKGDHYRITYFSPIQEVQLCGHATLAAAHIVWEELKQNRAKNILFKANQEDILVSRENGWIKMGFPKDSLSNEPLPVSMESAIGFSDGIIQVLKSRIGWFLIEVENEELVRKAAPDFSRLVQEKCMIIVTSRSGNREYDFVSRFFAPHIGISEDPATGYAHTTLGQFWGDKLGKNDLIGFQLSKRTGVVRGIVEKERNQILGTV